MQGIHYYNFENYAFTKTTPSTVTYKILNFIKENPACNTKALYENGLHYKKSIYNGQYPTHGIISALANAQLIEVHKVKNYNVYFLTNKGLKHLEKVSA